MTEQLDFIPSGFHILLAGLDNLESDVRVGTIEETGRKPSPALVHFVAYVG